MAQPQAEPGKAPTPEERRELMNLLFRHEQYERGMIRILLDFSASKILG